MDSIIIRGGRRLSGTVPVSGSKNSALPIMAACVLTDETSILHNVPHLRDIDTMIEILSHLGVKIRWIGPSSISVDPSAIAKYKAPYELVRRMRASISLLGPLLGRFKKAVISMPGGCVIGPRPIDLHLKGLRALNAKLFIQHGYVAADGREMRGGDIFLGGRFGSSVLATANVMAAACLTPGRSTIEGAACEPEIVDLSEFLCKMGAVIEGAGSHVIVVEGQARLKGAEHRIIYDRIEAGTYLIAGAMTGGPLFVENADFRHLFALIDKLKETGTQIECGGAGITVSRRGPLSATELTTLPYPGFPTDLQAQMTALLCITPGISVVTEKVYPERFMHISELNRLGAKICLEGSSAVITGVESLSGAPVMASDLRASAALLLAGLAADGQTTVHRVYHLDRGYERMDRKLSLTGADIRREPQMHVQGGPEELMDSTEMITIRKES